MAHQVKAVAAKPANLSSWWKTRTNSHKLAFDLHTHAQHINQEMLKKLHSFFFHKLFMYCGLFWSCDCHSARVGLKLYFAVGERCWLQEQVVFLSLTPPPK